jgi:hypothetical protein
MRVRIRRFSSVQLKHIEQPWKPERVEVSDRKGVLQGRTVRQMPRAMGTAGGLSREVNADIPLARFRKAHLAAFPLLPDQGWQPASDPLI